MASLEAKIAEEFYAQRDKCLCEIQCAANAVLNHMLEHDADAPNYFPVLLAHVEELRTNATVADFCNGNAKDLADASD